jgi:hypothetical protein
VHASQEVERAPRGEKPSVDAVRTVALREKPRAQVRAQQGWGVNKALFMNNEFEYGVFRLFKLMNRAGADYSYS